MSFWGRVKETVREVRTGTTVGGEAHRAPDGSVTASQPAEGSDEAVYRATYERFAGQLAGEADNYREAGFTPWMAAQWANMGFLASEAKDWTDAGFRQSESAQAAAYADRHHYTPEQAYGLHRDQLVAEGMARWEAGVVGAVSPDGTEYVNEDGEVRPTSEMVGSVWNGERQEWEPDPAHQDQGDVHDGIDHDAVAQELADRLPGDWADNDGFVDDDHEDQGASFDEDEDSHEHADYPHEPGTLYDCEACEEEHVYDDDVHCAVTAEAQGDAEKTAQVEEDAADQRDYDADAQAELDDEAQEVTQETQVAEKVAEVEAKTADLAAQWDEIFDEADVPELTEAEQVEQDARDAAREEAFDLREAARDEKDQAKQQEMVAKVKELEDATGVSEPEYAPTTEQQEAWKEQGTTRDEATTTVDHTDEAYVSASQPAEATYTVEVTRHDDAVGPAPTETTTAEGIEQGGVVEVTSAVTVVVAATTSGDGTASNYHAEPANAATTTGGTTATSSSAGASSGMCM